MPKKEQNSLSLNYRESRSGFTLIELVMVVLLLGILAAIAIPNFIDFRTDAKNATTQGAVGALRSAIAIATAAVQLKEDPTVPSPKYPTILEMQANQFLVSHPVLSGVNIMDPQNGIPKNPWSISTLSSAFQNSIINCNVAKSLVFSTSGQDNRGWCYRETSGEIWANSNLNSASSSNKSENTF